MRHMTVTPVSSPLNAAFAISRGSKTSAETVLVEITQDGQTGRGECVPYARYGESRISVVAKLQGLRAQIDAGLSRTDLQKVMSPGAARCAVDCALWDLESKLTKTPVWKLADLPKPKVMPTTMTLSLDSPELMATAATATPASLLKLKIGAGDNLARIEAVHKARPDAKLILDGNEGIDPEDFPALCERAASLGVILLEQPFPAENDDALISRSTGLSICADESAHTADGVQALAKKYDAVNIKLDKTGGLTEALKMAKEARACGMDIMIGCMVGGSLSMAPALMLGAIADLIDLDGPLWLEKDIENGLKYNKGKVSPPLRALWG